MPLIIKHAKDYLENTLTVLHADIVKNNNNNLHTKVILYKTITANTNQNAQ